MNKKNLEIVMNKTEQGWETSIPTMGIKELGESEDEAIDKATDTLIQQKMDQMDWDPVEITFNIQ